MTLFVVFGQKIVLEYKRGGPSVPILEFSWNLEASAFLLNSRGFVLLFRSLRLREMMRRSLRAAGVGRHESGPSSSDHQDPVSPPIAPPSWVPDPPPMDPGECI